MKETHPDYDEDYDRPKDGLCWSDARNLLHKVEAINGHIRHGENPILPSGRWDLSITAETRRNREKGARCRKGPSPNNCECSSSQAGPFGEKSESVTEAIEDG